MRRMKILILIVMSLSLSFLSFNAQAAGTSVMRGQQAGAHHAKRKVSANRRTPAKKKSRAKKKTRTKNKARARKRGQVSISDEPSFRNRRPAARRR